MNSEKDFYNNLTKRNGFFIDSSLQLKIKTTTLLFIGCGLSSVITKSACRAGFTKFILADGDRVDVTNLNRQDFYMEDVGKNKAECLRESLLKINPYASIQVIPRYVGVDDVESLVAKGDIIINCADFNEVTYEIETATSECGKLSISPLNIGFGSVILAFNNESASLKDLTKGIAKNDVDYLKRLKKGINKYELPLYLRNNLIKVFLFIARKNFFPQNIIAAETSNIIVLNTIIRYLKGDRIRLAPDPINYDCESSYEQ